MRAILFQPLVFNPTVNHGSLDEIDSRVAITGFTPSNPFDALIIGCYEVPH
jgi:hypothetical protein